MGPLSVGRSGARTENVFGHWRTEPVLDTITVNRRVVNAEHGRGSYNYHVQGGDHCFDVCGYETDRGGD